MLNKLSCLIDLHIHLDGSLSVNSVKQLAKLQNITLPSDAELKTMLSVKPDCKDLNEYLTKFDFPCSLLQTPQALTMATYNLFSELKNQGVMYAEVRFAPQKHTLGGLTQTEVVKYVLNGFVKADVKGGIILCCMRGNDNQAENIETIDVATKYLGKGVVAVDLAGAEALFPTSDYQNLFEYAKTKNVPFTIHAGEADGPTSIKSAISYGAKRIGHGVQVISDPELVKYVAKNNILLECCPTSNLNTQVFGNINEFPVKQFLDGGVKFTINTDNTAVSGTNLKNEWQKIITTFKLTNDQVKTILHNSVYGAFCNKTTKALLNKEIDNQFAKLTECEKVK